MRVRLRKEVYLVLAVLLIIVLFVIFRPKSSARIAETNIDGVDISTDEEKYIQFGQNDKIALGNPPRMFLVANGNIIKSSNIDIVEGSSMLPVDVLSDIIGGEVKVNPQNGDEFTIKNKETKITFRLNDQSAELNDKPEFLDVLPVREGKIVYVPLKQFFEYFGFNVKYVLGDESSEVAPLIPNFQQIFVWKYPEKSEPITKDEAVKILTKELKKAYKTNFGKKWTEPKEGETKGNAPEDEMRWKIKEGFSVKDENDRYYVIPVVWDFLVDKYTGKVYMFYQGQVYQYRGFDTKQKGTLAFAG